LTVGHAPAACTDEDVFHENSPPDFSFQYISLSAKPQEKSPCQKQGDSVLSVDPVHVFAAASHVLDEILHSLIPPEIEMWVIG
jgi:hypothetical protein